MCSQVTTYSTRATKTQQEKLLIDRERKGNNGRANQPNQDKTQEITKSMMCGHLVVNSRLMVNPAFNPNNNVKAFRFRNKFHQQNRFTTPCPRTTKVQASSARYLQPHALKINILRRKGSQRIFSVCVWIVTATTSPHQKSKTKSEPSSRRIRSSTNSQIWTKSVEKICPQIKH